MRPLVQYSSSLPKRQDALQREFFNKKFQKHFNSSFGATDIEIY